MNRNASLLWRLNLYTLAWLGFTVVPTRIVELRSLCIVYHMTGIRCPMCGMTRAFSNAMHGNFARAIEFNPLILIIFPLFWFLFADDAAALISVMCGRGYRSVLERIRDRIDRRA